MNNIVSEEEVTPETDEQETVDDVNQTESDEGQEPETPDAESAEGDDSDDLEDAGFDDRALAEIRKRNNEAKNLRARLRETEAERDALRAKVEQTVSLEDYEALKVELRESGVKAARDRELATLPAEAAILLRGETPEEIAAEAEALRALFAKRDEGQDERVPSAASRGLTRGRAGNTDDGTGYSFRQAKAQYRI